MAVSCDRANILIVDDLSDKLFAYRTVLEPLGENLIAVRSGAEALKQVLERDFAVILLDVQMPSMNGFEAAQLIRGRRHSAHTPIIFLTAFADEVQTTQGYATGAVDYISTPVVPEILRAKVRVFVELFRMRQKVAQQVEDHARRAAAEEAARRSAFLADASRALANTLDFEATLESLATVAIPTLADWCLVALPEGTGQIGRTRIAWTQSPDQQGPSGTLSSGHLAPWLEQIVKKVITSGQMEELQNIEGRKPTSDAPAGRDNSSMATPVSLGCLLAIPLVARGRTLGVLTLGLGQRIAAYTQSAKSLAEELAGRAAIALDNARLMRDIQEADRHKNEFLAMLAHELRNPLAPIRNAIEIMRIPEASTKDMVWARDLIDRQVVHLVRLVDDLLDVSRITRGKITLSLQIEDIRPLLSAVVETMRPTLKANEQVLSLSLPDTPLHIRADITRLAQVFSNLLVNAGKFTPDGGSIHVTVAQEDDTVVTRVRDSGHGIPKEMLARVFDMFTQLDKSLERSQGGLGIGLTIVRRLVEMHDGTVEAHSEGIGLGSEFVVRLPLQPSPRDGEPNQNGEPSLSQRDQMTVKTGFRVLVVDDNIDAADSLAHLLSSRGMEVKQAYDGPTALRVAEAFEPNAIILDIGLPGLSGYEVAQRIRENRDVLLIAASGYGHDEDRRRSRSAGFHHHLVKPVDVDALVELFS